MNTPSNTTLPHSSLRPSLRARSSSIALTPLAQLGTTRPRPRSNSLIPQRKEDEIGMGVTYLPPPSPPTDDIPLSLSVLALKDTFDLPAPVALAIDRPSSVYTAALGAVSSTRASLARLLTPKRSIPPKDVSRIALEVIPPVDVLTPPPSPSPIVLADSLPLPASTTLSSPSLAPFPRKPRRIISLILALSALFLLSTSLLLGLLYTLPIHLSHFPTTLSELNSLGAQLRTYADSSLTDQPSSLSGRLHVLLVLGYALLWSNAWSIPGSIILNVLTGVLLSPISATLYLTSLTALGSVLATALTLPAVPLLPSFSLSSTQPALLALPQLSPNHLVLLRLSGLAPWSLLNIYSALHLTPFSTIIWTCMLGCAPWCAVTAQVGALLAELTAGAEGGSVGEVLRRPSVLGKLVFLSLLGAGPVLMKSWIRGRLGDVGEVVEGEEPKGWVSWSTWSWSWSWAGWAKGWGGTGRGGAYARVARDEREREMDEQEQERREVTQAREMQQQVQGQER
ncbi:hypothetical protein DACRYDRAFT_12822 [Dacryopinax primogenitus]|uniref:Golgi apparatus membrane protein tvp38 n=1 Tax=Dacryopinax primogenitus (strain DJM 731) TaxID=1858805 RepID=M5GGS9_DACPD|nr:uncharacterized protein DACRYDRAFT_12822 [Dacryopinax primogenitus]EJU06018.1 hypothetical protein DACRYDRAFT_12822 [Dacryopinax primogenitus]